MLNQVLGMKMLLERFGGGIGVDGRESKDAIDLFLR